MRLQCRTHIVRAKGVRHLLSVQLRAYMRNIVRFFVFLERVDRHAFAMTIDYGTDNTFSCVFPNISAIKLGRSFDIICCYNYNVCSVM